MRNLKFVVLFLLVAAGTSAFTHKDTPTYRYKASVSSFDKVIGLFDKEAKPTKVKVPLQNVKVTNRTIKFDVKRRNFKFLWVGGKEVAMKFNEMELTYADLQNEKVLFNKFQAYFKRAGKRKPSSVISMLFIPEAHAISLNLGNLTSGLDFSSFMNLFTISNFNLFLGGVTQMASAFGKWMMDPNNPAGLHSSQLPPVHNVAPVPVGY